MRAYITKYALTTGIFEIDAEVCTGINVNMIVRLGGQMRDHFHKPDWHETMDEAIARAEAMRLAKIASLRKSTAKFEKLRFGGSEA